MLKFRFYMKSGNSFVVECDALRLTPNHSIQWESKNGQTKNRLFHVEFDAIEAIVREK